MSRRHVLVAAGCLLLSALVAGGCGKDSYISEPESIAAEVEFGSGVEIVTPTQTVPRYFADLDTITHNGRPAVGLRDLIGSDLLASPDLYGYRFIGTDGFYANMPGKKYGDNTWGQLEIGYLDLIDIHVLFETERDPNLRKGHNVKWLIQVQALRSIDVDWGEARKLAPIDEVASDTIPTGYPEAGAVGLMLTDIVGHVAPADLAAQNYLYRVLGEDGAALPRLLTWEEMHEAFYIRESDRIVMPEALGAAYQVQRPQTIRLEGSGS